jgi:hypothetical protein
MKPLLLILMLSACCILNAQVYGTMQAHEDSMLIYQTYKSQVDFIEYAAKDSNYKQAWYKRISHDDSITTAAKIRLENWNKVSYEPATISDHEGLGTAMSYPEPTMKKVKFSITDPQTKFIIKADGKTKSPYIEKTYFDEGGAVINIEKLDPAGKLLLSWGN